MVGMTLVEIREHVESLASEDGEYYVVCGRTGERPVPVAGKRFDGRAIARSAARATEQYRTALRRYDPHVPCYDLIVCQDADPARLSSRRRQQSGREAYQTLSEPVLYDATNESERRDRIEFCHRVAGAIFETLSDAGYEALETAIVDAYFDLAETVDDPDELCLCLLESMATEIDAQLPPSDQADLLSGAAARLRATDTAEKPLEAALPFLEERGLIGDYARSPGSVDLVGGARSVVVRLSDYALSPRDGSLPVLPIALELYRRHPERPPTSLHVVDREDGWRITFVLADGVDPDGLASAPIDSEA
jgi:hypothetical protein